MSRYFVQEVYGKRFSGVNPSMSEKICFLLIAEIYDIKHMEA